jgi:hypothetical protein
VKPNPDLPLLQPVKLLLGLLWRLEKDVDGRLPGCPSDFNFW